MWDLPEPGKGPMTPASAGRFLTTGPPEKSSIMFLQQLCQNDLNAASQEAQQETQKMRAQSLGWEAPLEKVSATHSSILAWKIPWTEANLAGYSPCGCKETDWTEHTTGNINKRYKCNISGWSWGMKTGPWPLLSPLQPSPQTPGSPSK